MKDKFILTLESLYAGWADIIITSGNENIRIRASDVLYDTLSDFIEIAIHLLNGYDCKRSVYQELSLKSDEISIEANIKPDRNIELKIGMTIILCTIQRFARQVLQIFDSYKYEHGVDEYEAEWRYRFPEKKLETLRDLLQINK